MNSLKILLNYVRYDVPNYTVPPKFLRINILFSIFKEHNFLNVNKTHQLTEVEFSQKTFPPSRQQNNHHKFLWASICLIV